MDCSVQTEPEDIVSWHTPLPPLRRRTPDALATKSLSGVVLTVDFSNFQTVR